MHQSSHACDGRGAREELLEVVEDLMQVVPGGVDFEGGVDEEEEEGGCLW